MINLPEHNTVSPEPKKESSNKKILKNNSAQFLKDFKRVREVMVYAKKSKTYLCLLKKEVRKRGRKQQYILLHQ